MGFGALSGDLGYIPSMRAGEDFDRDLDDDFRITMRKMTKKDSVTKMKVNINDGADEESIHSQFITLGLISTV